MRFNLISDLLDLLSNFQYNKHEMKYGFPVTEYFVLVAASKVLDALKTVWKSTEDWETMYTK